MPRNQNNNDPAMTKAYAIRSRIKAAMQQWRAAKHFTQGEAAGLLGVSRRTYEKYEGDPKRGIPMHVVAQFAVVADADIEWLILGRKRRKTAAPSLPALVGKATRKIKSVA